MGKRNPKAEILTLRQRLDDARKHHERRAPIERRLVTAVTQQLRRENRADRRKASTV